MSDNETPVQSRETQSSDDRREPTNLSFRYGTIGIEAVAAAASYVGLGKKPSAAPVAPRIDQRFVESAI
jgi:hypothetical protein